jgi:hypothetical protein
MRIGQKPAPQRTNAAPMFWNFLLVSFQIAAKIIVACFGIIHLILLLCEKDDYDD